MPPLGTTNLSLPRLRMQDLLAACPTLRSIVSPADLTSAGAIAHIHSPYAMDTYLDPTASPLVLTNPRPRVMVNHGDFMREKTGSTYGAGKGSLFVSFEFLPDPAAAGDLNKELASFEDAIGKIWDEIEGRVAQDKGTNEAIYSEPDITHINVTRYMLFDGPAQCFVEEERELFYGAIFLVEWIG
jgi:hypothetical protein